MSLSAASHSPNDDTFNAVRFRERIRARVGSVEIFTFRVGDELFAFELRAVDEVLEAPIVYPVPASPPGMAGVCRYNGATLVVARASALLGVESPGASTVLVMRRGNSRLGVLVDDVLDVETVDIRDLKHPPYDEEDDFLVAVRWRDGALTSILDARSVIGAGASLLALAPA